MRGEPMKADAWHVKVADLTWCNYHAPLTVTFSLADDARRGRYLPTCSHMKRSHAEAMVEKLHELGIKNARVVDGPCDQRDAFDYWSEEG